MIFKIRGLGGRGGLWRLLVAPGGSVGFRPATKASPSHQRARTRPGTLRHRLRIIHNVATNIPEHLGRVVHMDLEMAGLKKAEITDL